MRLVSIPGPTKLGANRTSTDHSMIPSQPLITAVDLTEDQIYDAAARLIAPWSLCFIALGPQGEARNKAREQIAGMLREEQRK